MSGFTFGYEAEFQTNVEPLLGRLHSLRMAGDRNLHGYHCRCDSCDFDSGFAYRGQSDSSCGGEIISAVCDDHEEGREWMRTLEACAVEVDAEPSLNAGFHVHVGILPMTREYGHEEGRHLALWNYLRWEPLLGEIAQGRFEGVRSFNETMRWAVGRYGGTIIECAEDQGYDLGSLPWGRVSAYGAFIPEHPMDIAWLESRADEVNPVLRPRFRDWVYGIACGVDRHSWLNVCTRNDATFEFRLWNSTRSAWRMETFVRTSLLFVNPDAVDDLATKPTTMRSFLALADRHDAGLKALIQRQLDSPKTSGPFTLTPAA